MGLIDRERTIDHIVLNMNVFDADGNCIEDWEARKKIITDLLDGVPDEGGDYGAELKKREMTMGIGEARAIFEALDSDKYLPADKIDAIRTVIGMETHSSITKAVIINAFRWMLNNTIPTLLRSGQ